MKSFKWLMMAFLSCLGVMVMTNTAYALKIGVPAVAPWGDGREGAFQSVLTHRLTDMESIGDLEFVSLPPPALSEGLKSGKLDAVIASDLAGMANFAEAFIPFGHIRFGLASLDGQWSKDQLPERIGFWGSQNEFSVVFGEEKAEHYRPISGYAQGIEKMLTGEVDALFGEQYSIYYEFRRYGVIASDFLPLAERDVFFWRNNQFQSDEIDQKLTALQIQLKANPISTLSVDKEARSRVRARGQEILKITTPLLPHVNDDDRFTWIRNFATQIDLANQEVSLIVAQPFLRSLRSTAVGSFDIHIALIETDHIERIHPELTYVGPPLFYMDFYAYSLDTVDITVEDLANDSRLSLITDLAHAPILGPKMEGTACFDCALRMLVNKRMDALLFADAQIDPLIKEMGLTNIQKTQFKRYAVRAVSSLSKADIANRWISDGIHILRKQQNYDPLILSGPPHFKLNFNDP